MWFTVPTGTTIAIMLSSAVLGPLVASIEGECKRVIDYAVAPSHVVSGLPRGAYSKSQWRYSIASTSDVKNRQYVLFEVNGRQFFVPKTWVWFERAGKTTLNFGFSEMVPPLEYNEAVETVHFAPQGLGIYLGGDAGPPLHDEFSTNPLARRVWITAGASFKPGVAPQSIDDLPESEKSILGPITPDDLRQLGRGETYYGIRPEDVSPSGSRLRFACGIAPDPTGLNYCWAQRAALSGVSVQYFWNGKHVAPSAWRDMDKQIQTIIEWLAQDPVSRPALINLSGLQRRSR